MRIALVSSDKLCGIHEVAKILHFGFEACGHKVDFIGVERWNDQDLNKKMNRIAKEVGLVIFEHSFGIFSNKALIPQLFKLRFVRRKKVILSLHELEPMQFALRHRLNSLIDYKCTRGLIGELPKVICGSINVGLTFAIHRLSMLLLGWLPNVIVIHSSAMLDQLPMLGDIRAKTKIIPLPVKKLQDDKIEKRKKLGLREDAFVFLIPGFFFRRKRIIEVIRNLPQDSLLVVAGSSSDFDPGCIDEVTEYIRLNEVRNVRIEEGYGQFVEDRIVAADVVVLFYQWIFQSATASQAIGAGKPCIFTNIEGFQQFKGAGIFVKNESELRKAMMDIRGHKLYTWLQENANMLREELKPERIATMYLCNQKPLGLS